MRSKLALALIGAIVTTLVAAVTTAGAAPTAEENILKKVKKSAGEVGVFPLTQAELEQGLKDSKAICLCPQAVAMVTNRVGAVVSTHGNGQSFANCLLPWFDTNGAVDPVNTTTCGPEWVPITK